MNRETFDRHQQVNDEVANVLVAQLLYLANDDPDKDITLYINSPGGSVSAGMAIYDAMQVRGVVGGVQELSSLLLVYVAVVAAAPAFWNIKYVLRRPPPPVLCRKRTSIRRHILTFDTNPHPPSIPLSLCLVSVSCV